MTAYLAVRDGGKTNENGAFRFLRKASSNGQGQIQSSDLAVSEHGTPNKSIDISIGDIVLAYQDYALYGWTDAVTNVVVTSNSSGNPRIDAVVAYVDLTVVSAVSNNNPGALKFMVVAGTPAGSPSAPDNTAIQSAVGAGNPFFLLAHLAIANGYATVVNANITDKRVRYLLGNSGAIPPFCYPGTLLVQNAITPNWIVPPGIAAINRLDATALTAPTGASLTLRLYNVTQSHDIGTITISAGNTTATNTSMTNASVNTGDVIRFDCTAIGSTVPGSDVLVQPS